MGLLSLTAQSKRKDQQLEAITTRISQSKKATAGQGQDAVYSGSSELV